MILEAAVFLTLATGTPLPRPAPIMDERPDTLDMLFLGDIMMHDAQLESARTPEGYDFCGYFPAYEIVMDELRDYRFYAEDMVHPSAQAVEYIWERFCEAAVSEKDRETIRKMEKTFRQSCHRPNLTL